MLRNFAIFALLGLLIAALSLGYSTAVSGSVTQGGQLVNVSISRGFPLQFYTEETSVSCSPSTLHSLHCPVPPASLNALVAVADYLLWLALGALVISVIGATHLQRLGKERISR